ncbi:hypothetical protein SAMN04487954_1181, partial [Billgrantia gudaonensis]
ISRENGVERLTLLSAVPPAPGEEGVFYVIGADCQERTCRSAADSRQ